MIFVNARFLTQSISGVQRYAIEISRQLKKLNNSICFIAPKNIIHHEIANELGVQIVGTLTGHLWEQIELPLYLKKQGSPLLLNLCNTAPVFYCNKVVTIHDVAFERFPKSFSWQFRYAYQFAIPKIAQSSKRLLTDSQFSRDEISELYKLDRSQIEIVHCAVSDVFRCGDVRPSEKYILAVSSLNYQKNFHALIQAFNVLKDADIKLYLVGAINNNFADHKLIKDIESNPNIQFLGRVEDDELAKLYSNAQCFVYPSLYEGFGIPPLEAQACGCPVIASNAASLPEVCGDSVVYCDPYSVDDIADKINMVLSDELLQSELRAKGFENIKRFSWEKSAQQIINIIEEMK
jgi:glycosyltransferase involved in cell wall biosynthesis